MSSGVVSMVHAKGGSSQQSPVAHITRPSPPSKPEIEPHSMSKCTDETFALSLGKELKTKTKTLVEAEETEVRLLEGLL